MKHRWPLIFFFFFAECTNTGSFHLKEDCFLQLLCLDDFKPGNRKLITSSFVSIPPSVQVWGL